MKKRNIFIFFYIFLLIFNTYGQENFYNNGNGTILKIEEYANRKNIIRKHEQELFIGEYATESSKIIYTDTINKIVQDKLEIDDKIIIKKIMLSTELKTDIQSLWFYIQYHEDKFGWTCYGINEPNKRTIFTDPYENDNWSIINVFKGENNFTERKVQQFSGSIIENLNVRDKPGLKKSKIIDAINTTQNNSFPVNIISMTAEQDCIDGKKDHWLKIIYKGNKEGWVFGAYVDVYVGGYKYRTPENIILSMLYW